MIEYVAFDLDDTLYEHSMYEFQLYKIISDKLSEDWGIDSLKLFEKMKRLFNDKVQNHFFDVAITDIITPFPQDWDDYVVNEILPIYRNYKPNTPLQFFPGVEELLDNIKKSYTLVLITNGRVETQTLKIDSLNIKTYFEHIYISDQFSPPLRKPDERIFKQVLNDLRISPEKMIYIGDRYDIDGSSEKCGIKFLHISEIDTIWEVIKK